MLLEFEYKFAFHSKSMHSFKLVLRLPYRPLALSMAVRCPPLFTFSGNINGDLE